MKITVEINVSHDALQEDLGYWLALGRKLDIDDVVLKSAAQSFMYGQSSEQIQDDQKIAVPIDTVKDTDVAAKGAEPESEDEGETEEQQPAGNLPPGVAPPTTGNRRGPRGRKAAKTAEEQVQALAGQELQASPQPETRQPSTGLPPGVTMPAGLPPGVTAPAPAEPQVAMPKVEVTSASADANGVMALEDFKAEAMALYNEAQSQGKPSAYPFNIIRAETWPDGSAKDFQTMAMDKVPAAQRRRVLDASVLVLSQ